MAAYMAALFHDIGYPETHLQSLRRRIFSYMPNMHSRDPQRDVVSSGVFSLLEKSLLFTLVPFEELQNRLYCEKIDHGTISAIAFLLHFYEGGIINQLEPYKTAAVELAALAIYKHTYTYSSAENGQGREKALAYRPVFTEDPFSFLLEWINPGKTVNLAKYESLVEKSVQGAQARSKILDDMAENENFSKVKTNITDAIRLYTMLYVFGRLCLLVRENREDPVKVLRPVMDTIAEEYHGSEAFNCLLQLSRAYTLKELYTEQCIPEGYPEQFIPGNWRGMLSCPAEVDPDSMKSLYSEDFTYTAIDLTAKRRAQTATPCTGGRTGREYTVCTHPHPINIKKRPIVRPLFFDKKIQKTKKRFAFPQKS